MLMSFLNDEAGVVVSAEIVLVTTILVLGLIVGLVEVQSAMIAELSDISSAIGNIDQSFSTSGYASLKYDGGIKARTFGAAYLDVQDDCDGDANVMIVCDDPGEVPAYYADDSYVSSN